MIETVLLTFILAKINKLKLLPLFKHWSSYPAIFMTLIYIYLEYTVLHGDYYLLQYSNIFRIVYLSSFLILAIYYDQTKKFILGIGFMIIGTVLNKIAIKANSETMPLFPDLSYVTGVVKPETPVYGDFHIIGDHTSKLIPFCDIFDNGISIYSIGDLFIFSFVFLIVFFSIKNSNKQ